jgi:hypothetical protein
VQLVRAVLVAVDEGRDFMEAIEGLPGVLECCLSKVFVEGIRF